jgi:hypothetical protein
MHRRDFITLLGGAAAVWPLAVPAQQAEQRMRSIGVLYSLAEDDPESVARRTAFEEALKQLGWTNGGNIRIDYRWAGNAPEMIRKFVCRIGRVKARRYFEFRQRRGRSNGAGDPRYSNPIPAGY